MSSRLSPLLLSAFLLLIPAGCVAPGMGGVSMNVPVSGGGTVPIEFDKHGIVHGENRDLRIESAALVPDFKDKEVSYRFAFVLKQPEELRQVRVEDVSDDTPATLVNDEHPTVTAQNMWLHLTPKFKPDDTNIRWLYQIENNVRVYRFTVVTADGRMLQVYEGANYPAMIKRFLRQQLGLEKIDKR